jgi:hypothetical protein
LGRKELRIEGRKENELRIEGRKEELRIEVF